MADKNQTTKQFEVALEELEGIVEQLESGELSLEDSLAVFEKGVGLVKYCNQKLTEVEKKIEVLIKDKEGKLQLKALELETGGERKEPDE
ncbi:MAG TPA: exodeoxyribonuclease VII small subunit [Candidatus Udaeobacter sp.]|jgi:exodeoxyribonuclease VII small subunit|nr:exodeoxyribonuclease VII small subunit [Candidatus Udaeobacter sp.]